MNKYSLSKEDLRTHLRDQVDFIIASAISYDNGVEGEAKRLAATIRVLIYDTKSCSALLTQLHKMNILFYDSSLPDISSNPLPQSSLTMMQVKNSLVGAKWIAPIDAGSPRRMIDKKVGFNRWWRSTYVIKDSQNNLWTRKDLIINVADKDGGAHVDPKIDESYANLTKFNSIGWKVHINDKEIDIGNPVPPAIRQIAHEVIKTLKDGVLDLFTDKTTLLEKFEEYEKHCLIRNKELGLIKEEVSHAPTSGKS